MAVLKKPKKKKVIKKVLEPIRKPVNFEKEEDKEMYFDFIICAYNIHDQDFAKRIRTLIRQDVEANKVAIDNFKNKKNGRKKP